VLFVQVCQSSFYHSIIASASIVINSVTESRVLDKVLMFQQQFLWPRKGSIVNICLVPDQQISHLLNRDLLMSYLDFTQKFLGSCDINPKAANIPIRVSLGIGYVSIRLIWIYFAWSQNARTGIALYVRPVYFVHLFWCFHITL